MGATQGRTQVDFEGLAFSEEGHFMSSKKVNLPQGSQRNSFKVRIFLLPLFNLFLWYQNVLRSLGTSTDQESPSASIIRQAMRSYHDTASLKWQFCTHAGV